ncbi:MAG: DUF3795 domain-containing protein [Saprospiraceae bacterium]|nr:DUF3795 domain-containing protein [Saprospiraceae bacterium]
METKERLNLVAACGIDCGICELYICKDNKQLYDYLISIGIPESKIPCEGCRANHGNCPIHPEACETYKCVNSKKLEFCCECNEFPCVMLNPAADRADKLPHNLKVFNLCKIKNSGLEAFVKESPEIKNKYFKGEMVIGKGPQL